MLANPAALTRWAAEHHPAAARTGAPLKLIGDRAPLIVFGGDVGSGKSALAESFGCDLSHTLKVPAYLWRLKLAARGSGLVGEMTSLIGEAFDDLRVQGGSSRTSNGIKAIQIFGSSTRPTPLVQIRAKRPRCTTKTVPGSTPCCFRRHRRPARRTGLPVIIIFSPTVSTRSTQRCVAEPPRPSSFTARPPNSAATSSPTPSGSSTSTPAPSTSWSTSPATTLALLLTGYTFSDVSQRHLHRRCDLEAFLDKPITGDLIIDIAQRMERAPIFTRAKPCRSHLMPGPLPQPTPTGVRIAGDRYQWLHVWRACLEVLRASSDPIAHTNPAIAVGVEADGAGNTVDDAVLYRHEPAAHLLPGGSGPRTRRHPSGWATSPKPRPQAAEAFSPSSPTRTPVSPPTVSARP